MNTVEETASGFSRTVSQIRTEVQGAVATVVVYYAQNSSDTVPPTDNDPSWSTTVPAWSDGMFIWQKTVTTYVGGTSRSDVCLTDWYEATSTAYNTAATVQEGVDNLAEDLTDSVETVRTYAESLVSQKADEIELSISTVTGTLTTDIQDCRDTIAETDETLTESINTLSSRVTDQEDALQDYMHETSTYFRFGSDGLNIGKQVDGDESPYSISIDNEKMGFLQNGTEIAYVQYNKMHINAIEAMDRLSVGAAADGGYFDFISTIYGMGVKWRSVNQPESTPRSAQRLMAKSPVSYMALQDEDGTFTVDFGGKTK